MYVPTIFGNQVLSFNCPEVTTVIGPEISLAVAPASAYEAPNSTSILLAPLIVTTGAVVSTTFTTLEAVAVFPSLSVAEYETV